MSLTTEELKNAFSRFVTGITVVTCSPEGANFSPVGLTVNSFTSVSLDPPLVLWCLDNSSSLNDHFSAASHYAVNILHGDQQSHSEKFSKPGNHELDGVSHKVTDLGLPILDGALANISCKIVQRYQAGDHTIMLGEVVEVEYVSAKPLMYVGRTYQQGTVIND